MSYLSIATIRQDSWLQARAAACAAVEGEPSPDQWVFTHSWQLAAQPGWGAAWDSALVSHPEDDYQPGRDEAVITDYMILSAVQKLRHDDTPTE